MKRACMSICVIALAGFIFSSGVTLFEQAVHNIQSVLGHDTNKSSLVSYI